MIPYGRQLIEEDDINAVIDVLRSDYLTTGPKVVEFEKAVAEYVGSRSAVAVSSGTAALHSTMFALGIGRGDEVIVPAMTFAATANCVVYQGGIPVFVDVDPEFLLIDPSEVQRKISKKTKAIISVDYTGHPCDYDALKKISDKFGLTLIADACHSFGADFHDKKVGTLADMTVFSFHPVKHIAAGEGGMITTDNPHLAKRLKLFRNHGISTDFRQREQIGSWQYEMIDLGFNYRLADIQCALGISQLKKIDNSIMRRQEIANYYQKAFSKNPNIHMLHVRRDVKHAYHLFVIAVEGNRAEIFQKLRENGIGVNVHYIPVHLHPFYREKFNTGPDMCPVAEKSYERILSLPMYPSLSDSDLLKVTRTVNEFI
jgi:perosamine synthetase